MPRETIGYTRLEWVCPNCGGKNPGPVKTCITCGAPQPVNVAFQAPDRDDLVTDVAESQKAEAGPDIHCPYCGARNSAGTAACSQCGGDLKGGALRASGQVIGALNQAPQLQVKCPSCGSPNPDTALRCANCGATLAPAGQAQLQNAKGNNKFPVWGYILAGLAFLILAFGAFWLVNQLTKRSDVTAAVQSVAWQRTIAIEKYGPVTRDNWKDSIPADAVLGQCELRVHHTQDQPAANATKICGTPYKVDKGNGYSAVVQDCKYQVKQDYCKYTINEWAKSNDVTAQGVHLNPVWPDPKITDKNLRQGSKSETYTVNFNDNSKVYTYHPIAPDFNKYHIGSSWELVVNGFDSIVSIRPK